MWEVKNFKIKSIIKEMTVYLERDIVNAVNIREAVAQL